MRSVVVYSCWILFCSIEHLQGFATIDVTRRTEGVVVALNNDARLPTTGNDGMNSILLYTTTAAAAALRSSERLKRECTTAY